MTRIARVAMPDAPYHITQRGNNRMDVFFTDNDRLVYLDMLKTESEKYELELHGYCLMTNHVHVLAVPKNERSMSLALGRTNLKYTMYINRRHERSGRLWQNRFYSCPVEDKYFFTVMNYIERNPVRAGMAQKAWTYQWSSAAPHAGKGADITGSLQMEDWKNRITANEWIKELESTEDEETTNLLREKTQTGRPLGGESFISNLESAVDRRLRPLANGRPKKMKLDAQNR